MKLYKNTPHCSRIWECTTDGSSIIITFGMVNGSQQTDVIKLGTPEQADTEAQSRINKKILREGYSEDPNCEPPGLPMLLHIFRDHGDKLPQQVIYQPKYNGARAICSSTVMATRKMDTIVSMPHIQDELSALPQGMVLDGEIYCHGMSLQDQGHYVRSHTSRLGHKDFKLMVFDVQSEYRYFDRYKELESLFNEYNFKYLELVPNEVAGKHVAEKVLEKHLNQGFEGTVVRAPNSLYEKDTRSYGVQKLKPLMTGWFKITDITCAKTGREKGAAIVVCVTPEGQPFKARKTGTLYERCFMYDNKKEFIGGEAYIEFSEYTNSNIPSHPRCTEVC